MACCLSSSAWQHLSSLNTLWNVEKWFGCLYDSGICSGGAVCLFKYSPKGGACFPKISSNCWPKQEKRVSREGTSQKPGWVLAEVWLILTRQLCQSHFQNAGLQIKHTVYLWQLSCPFQLLCLSLNSMYISLVWRVCYTLRYWCANAGCNLSLKFTASKAHADKERCHCREKQYLAKSNHLLRFPSCFLGVIKTYLRASSSSGLVPVLKETVQVFETTCKTYRQCIKSHGC